MKDEDEQTTKSDLRVARNFLSTVAFLGVFLLFLWALGRDHWLSILAFGLLIMGGSALVGGVFGLLFGIPKAVSDPAHAAAVDGNNIGDARADTASNDAPPPVAVNTNLEQISDWLTKIIVGVSLTELPAIRGHFYNMANYFGHGFIIGTQSDANSPQPIVAAAVIIYGLTFGFLAGYLLTRIFLPGAFARVENALRQRNNELVSQISEVKESTEAAGRAQGKIYNDLYRYHEQGFRDAISQIKHLFSSSAANKRNAALWVYLAAASGQAYRWEKENLKDSDPKKKEILDSHRDQAYFAVKTALELGDSWRPVLQLMWDKSHPSKQAHEGVALGEQEDDLEMFYEDPAFKALLGH